MMIPYEEFLRLKVPGAENTGPAIPHESINPLLKPHQSRIVRWAVEGA